jgi:predicted dithiol-disulfide oxidoreductase (DUF899 family)
LDVTGRVNFRDRLPLWVLCHERNRFKRLRAKRLLDDLIGEREQLVRHTEGRAPSRS